MSGLLSVDPIKRPSIHDILRMPFITNRIRAFLTESMRNVEFSHTIIHDKNFVNPFVNINKVPFIENS